MVFFFYNVSEQIKQAMEIYSLYGSAIMQDNRCSSLIDELRDAIEDSWKLMKELGVVNICSSCAEEKAGGCCHFGIETCYTDMIILMNLLLGVKIPGKRKLDNKCLFVGELGCQLKARFKTCIHHLCPEIINFLADYDRFRLRATNSYEIKVTIQAESVIRDWIQEREKVE